MSDYKCRPVFFDEKNKRVEECIGMIVVRTTVFTFLLKLILNTWVCTTLFFCNLLSLLFKYISAKFFAYVGRRVFINPEKVSQVCKVNPCEFTRCLLDFTEERCVVGTRCQAVYYNPEGQPQKCTGMSV